MTKANDDLNKATPRDRQAPRGVTADQAAKLMQPVPPTRTPGRPGAKDVQVPGKPSEHTNYVRPPRGV